jgi:hypothetical protein
MTLGPISVTALGYPYAQPPYLSGTLSCVLTSTRGTTLRARVHVDGAHWRADWAPVSG